MTVVKEFGNLGIRNWSWQLVRAIILYLLLLILSGCGKTHVRGSLIKQWTIGNGDRIVDDTIGFKYGEWVSSLSILTQFPLMLSSCQKRKHKNFLWSSRCDGLPPLPKQTVFKSSYIPYPLYHKMHLYLSRGGNKHEVRYLYDPLVAQDHDELLPGEPVHGWPDDHPLVPRPKSGQGAQRQERVHPASHLLQDRGVLHR